MQWVHILDFFYYLSSPGPPNSLSPTLSLSLSRARRRLSSLAPPLRPSSSTASSSGLRLLAAPPTYCRRHLLVAPPPCVRAAVVRGQAATAMGRSGSGLARQRAGRRTLLPLLSISHAESNTGSRRWRPDPSRWPARGGGRGCGQPAAEIQCRPSLSSRTRPREGGTGGAQRLLSGASAPASCPLSSASARLGSSTHGSHGGRHPRPSVFLAPSATSPPLLSPPSLL